ncbi:MAG: carbamoyl-phosphate synthase large subunit [Rickettsiales bacterium]|jgi:carbamoyl-phosphate synthase large subunit
MPKNTEIKSILIIGAGPIVIGQACEFDYSGTQACKALKDEGYKTILINSNPATIMTDQQTADRTYIEPITPEVVEQIIIKEKPDAILPTVGGQTALNCALSLEKNGVLKKYGVKMIGADSKAIRKAEDRELFNRAMAKIGLEVPKNAVINSIDQALEVVKEIGLPAIIRPSFTLGGSGGGIAETIEELKEIVKNGLSLSPVGEVQIDESIIGWKEYEMEVVRDSKDNAIIICSIENIDPMGIHTGDSITVAPALTLTDKEYQQMRNASIAVIREIGVETGGSNVQFAVNPNDGRLVVIEMNPRVSRSSALASKATGFPIAKVAALLAVGYGLDEIQNDITKVTPASFEPTIDYIVTKVPRFTFEKFQDANPILSSAMRSVGEAMAIGRNFAESIQKALCSMEIGLDGFTEVEIEGVTDKNSLKENQQIIKKKLRLFSPNRILLIAHALRYKISIEEVCQITYYDKWFVSQIAKIIKEEEKIKRSGIKTDKAELLKLKKLGFSDSRLAKLTNRDEFEIADLRSELGVKPVFKRIDTCSAEFKSFTKYMYSCYEGDHITGAECEAEISDKKKVIILGGGPNRIGQGIEFDYACVHACFTLSEAGFETIMINCNPETVSTDYDTSDRLYFEPMTAEYVLEIVRREQEKGELLGVIVQFGGQTALKLAKYLSKFNLPIIGTPFDKIDLAEDRERFQQLLHKINLIQPENDICHKLKDIEKSVDKIGYPIVIRPSNVLGGRAMEIIYNKESLYKYIKHNKSVILDGPILIDKFLENAIEIDVDALSDGKDVEIVGIMQHIEEAGIHSGDSACCLPPFSLTQDQIQQIKQSATKLAKEIGVCGLMNVQYAIKDNQLYIIEVNPRASRTAPFVAKATGINIIKIASLLMVGHKLSEFALGKVKNYSEKYYSVKEVVFPFVRFSNTDILLGPEMKSTGEVMGVDKDFEIAFFKAQLGVSTKILEKGGALISVKEKDKTLEMIEIVKNLQECGYKIYATINTEKFLTLEGLENVTRVKKESEGGYNVVDLANDGKISLAINTSSDSISITRSFGLRRAMLMNQVFCFTTINAARYISKSIRKIYQNDGKFDIICLQDMANYSDSKVENHG